MARLGKVERAILEYLRLDKDCGDCEQAVECDVAEEHKNWNSPCHNYRSGVALVGELTCYVAGLASCPHREDWLYHMNDYSNAAYKSTLRAVHSLERKGRVRTEMRTTSHAGYGERFLWVELL